MLRERWPNLPITETHPKLTLVALGPSVPQFMQKHTLNTNEHRRDAEISAFLVWNGIVNPGNLRDLNILPGAAGLLFPAGPVNYFFPRNTRGRMRRSRV